MLSGFYFTFLSLTSRVLKISRCAKISYDLKILVYDYKKGKEKKRDKLITFILKNDIEMNIVQNYIG